MTALVEGAKRLVGRGRGRQRADRGAPAGGGGGPRPARRRARRRDARGRRAGHRADFVSVPTTRWWRWRGRRAPASPPRSTRSPGSTSPRSAYAGRPRRGRCRAPGARRTRRRAAGLARGARAGTRSPATACSTTKREDRELEGLVLLDLPDHDSTEVAHHVEVDRRRRRWPTCWCGCWTRRSTPTRPCTTATSSRWPGTARSCWSPQPHRRRCPRPQRPRMVADVERLLAADGLGGVPVLGHLRPARRRRPGAPRSWSAERVAAKKATRTRLMADVTAAGAAAAGGQRRPARPRRRDPAAPRRPGGRVRRRRRGAHVVVDAVEKATRAGPRRPPAGR